MPKPAVAGGTSRTQRQPRSAELQNVIEGRIEEICRDLVVEAKRMRQLQEQADELRRVIRQWAGHSEAARTRDLG